METVAPVDGGNASDTSSTRKTKSSPPVSQLVRLLWGEDTAELQMSIGHIPHIVMYLSLKLDSASPREEVSLYKMYIEIFIGIRITSLNCLWMFFSAKMINKA